MRLSKKRALVCMLAFAATAPLAACLLDLPTPIVDDDAGFDGSNPDTGLPDGFVPDGPPPDGGGVDTGTDGTMPPFDGGGCDGPCVLYKDMTLDPRILDNDGANVFVVNGSNEIDAVNIATPSLAAISKKNGDFINDMKVRGSFVYFTNAPMSTLNNAVHCPKTGCGANDVNRFQYISSNGNSRFIYGIDADGTNVFFTIDEAMASNGGIQKCTQGMNCGGVGPSLKSFDNPTKLIVNTNVAYWANQNKGGIYSCPTGNCSSVAMPMGNSIQDFAVDNANAYWIETGGNVWRQPKGMMAVQHVSMSCTGKAIESDNAGNLYILCDTELMRCPANASPCVPVTLAQGFTQGSDLTIAGAYVYYATRGNHTIWAVPK